MLAVRMPAEPDEVSVLMAVWRGDRADWLAEALTSLRTQTLPAAQVVIVEDGPISPELSQVIDDCGLPVTRVALPVNAGLSAALHVGLEHCRHDLVARADSDDLNEPTRFARQVKALRERPNLAALSAYVSEFTDDPDAPYAVRTVPLGTVQVARVARWRSPVNHPAAMLRLADVRAVGDYTGFTGMEDYFLWAKLLSAGYEIDNLPDVLVRMRAGAAQSERRGGLGYARTEINLMRSFVAMGFISRPHAAFNLLIRLPVRLLPGRVRRFIYRYGLRRK